MNFQDAFPSVLPFALLFFSSNISTPSSRPPLQGLLGRGGRGGLLLLPRLRPRPHPRPLGRLGPSAPAAAAPSPNAPGPSGPSRPPRAAAPVRPPGPPSPPPRPRSHGARGGCGGRRGRDGRDHDGEAEAAADQVGNSKYLVGLFRCILGKWLGNCFLSYRHGSRVSPRL